MQNAGAQVIMPWSVNAGFLSRICNTRGNMGWDVPIVGQTTLGSGQTKALLEKPEYWNKVYSNNFRQVCYANGKLPPKAAEFVERLKAAKIEFSDTLLWWVALGWDARHDDGRDVQDRRHQDRRHRRPTEQAQGLAGHLRHRHLDAGAAQRLPRLARS